MVQLLKITNIPIEYNYRITPGRLELKQAQNPSQRMTQVPSRLNIQTQNIQMRLDSTELRASLNLRTNGDFARYCADKGTQAAYETIGETVQFGNQMARIQDGVTIGQLIKKRMLVQPVTYTAFFPSADVQISWQPQELDLEYDAGSLEFDWEIMRNRMDYIPGKFQMAITQYPKVQIEYLGKPNYVPPSATPKD